MSWETFCNLNNVPPKYRVASVDNMTIPDDVRGTYRRKAQFLISRPCSTILIGKAGRGKTYFQYALLRALIESGKAPLHDIRFTRALDLDNRLVESYDRYSSVKGLIDQMVEPHFLFVDDFGIGRDTAKAERDYYDLIDLRTSFEKITVFSTNLDETALHKLYGERISSRLKEFTVIEFNGPDLREGAKL
jgi:DNA replication protein DnaC